MAEQSSFYYVRFAQQR